MPDDDSRLPPARAAGGRNVHAPDQRLATTGAKRRSWQVRRSPRSGRIPPPDAILLCMGMMGLARVPESRVAGSHPLAEDGRLRQRAKSKLNRPFRRDELDGFPDSLHIDPCSDISSSGTSAHGWSTPIEVADHRPPGRRRQEEFGVPLGAAGQLAGAQVGGQGPTGFGVQGVVDRPGDRGDRAAAARVTR